MKRIVSFAFAIIVLSCLAVHAKPRHPFPATPDEVGQNDRDLDDQIESVRVSISSVIAAGSTDYIQNRNTLQTGATSYAQFVYGSSIAVQGTTNNSVDLIHSFENLGTGGNILRSRNVPGGATINIDEYGTGYAGSFNTGIPNADLTAIEMSGAAHNVIQFNNDASIIQAGNLPLTLWTNNLIASSITARGEVIQPLQPCFLTTLTNTQTDATGDGSTVNVPFNSEVFDQSSSLTNSTFTASVTGRYLFTVSLRITGLLVTHTDYNITLTTSNRDYTNVVARLIADASFISLSVIADMDANDTARVTFTASGATKVVDVLGSASQTYWSGCLQ